MNFLPRELIGEISNVLSPKDAVELGKANKQFQKSLSRTDFGYKVNHYVSIDTVFPKRIHVIGVFTQFIVKNLDELNHLPSQTPVTHILFGHHFDEPISDINLPQTLTHLIFCYKFNQPVDDLK